jgi:hypothetical protein
MDMNDVRVLCIKDVYYVPVDDVSGVDMLGKKAVVALKLTKDWQKVYFTPGTANLEEDPVLGERAYSFTQRFSMDIPGEDDDSFEWVDSVENQPVLIKLICGNGTKLLGTLDSPCRMKIGYSMLGSGMVVRVERKVKEKARWLEVD